MTTTGDSGAHFLELLRDPPPPGLDDPAMIPTRLTRAVAAVLPVDGAGLSIHEGAGLRTPVGASDPDTSLAERLQFTYGDGPCLRAHDKGTAIAFDLDDIARNWPELHAALVSRLPFEAVLSLPLASPLGPTVVLDLYTREADRITRLVRTDVDSVIALLTEELIRAGEDGDGAGGVRWWDSPDAHGRNGVWQATGLAGVALGLDIVDALAVLRAHALATDRVVDDVAADIVAGTLDPATLGGPDAPDAPDAPDTPDTR